jgi:hypothetical protein
MNRAPASPDVSQAIDNHYLTKLTEPVEGWQSPACSWLPVVFYAFAK